MSMNNLASGKNYLQMATFILLIKVLSSLDWKYFVGRLFCDLKKAFECVKHDTLLAKWSFMGSLVQQPN